MAHNSAIDRILQKHSANEILNNLRTSLAGSPQKIAREPLCLQGEQGIPGQFCHVPIEESLIETKSPCSHGFRAYATLLCELSFGAEERLGLHVDPSLEKRFVRSYHSGQATSMLNAWIRMMGELHRRAKDRP